MHTALFYQLSTETFMTDIAFCQTKKDQFLRKISHFYGWLVANIIFAPEKRQTPSFIVTIQSRQLIHKDDFILIHFAVAASFQRLQALNLEIHSSFATQGLSSC